MMKKALLAVVGMLVIGGVALLGLKIYSDAHQTARLSVAAVQGTNPVIGRPRTAPIPLVNIAKPIGWQAGQRPVAAAGLRVQPFATGLDHPRWLLPLPNGDVIVAETNAPPKPDERGFHHWIETRIMGQAGAGGASPNRIVLLRDTDNDGIADERWVLLGGLHSPFGMALVGDTLFIADTDALVKVPFTPGQTRIDRVPVKLTDLPGGPIDHHWTKNVIASADGQKLYVTVGSNSNVGERGMGVERDRAAIWEVDASTGAHRIYAYGIRNPNGMGWEPTTGQLWTVSNERDGLGSDLVPDYLTYVQFGGFYGWPWYYWGGIPDSRPKEPDVNNLQDTVIRPDYALGPHTASLGLAFASGAKLGPRFMDGAFIGQHGSWNRKPASGYKVVFVPFRAGRPVDKPINVLTGFLDEPHMAAHGRPVGVAIDRGGALLVADDVGNTIWRVTAAQQTASRR